MQIYRSKIDPNRPNHARDFKNAITRAPTGISCIFIDGNLFIPFKCVTKNSVQLNVGKTVKKHQIPSGLSLLCGILNQQKYDSNEWILGKKETRLFSIRNKNRMFKERSNDLCPDFILNFEQVIRRKAWDTDNFESSLMDIDISKYYILALDDKCTYGVPICFTFIDRNFYVYLNHESKYFKIKKMQSILKDKTNIDKIKTTNIMDWNHKYRFIFNNGKEIMLNQILFNMNNVISSTKLI